MKRESKKTGEKREKQVVAYVREVSYAGGYKKYVVHYSNTFIQTKRVFNTLDEALNYKAICDDFINKARFHKQTKTQATAKTMLDFSEYPENLLHAIGINPDDYQNYFEEILPNFEENWQKASEILNERELHILMLRYKNYKALEEIGKSFGLTRERIRQLESKAIRKLKHPMRINFLVKGKEKLELISHEEMEEIRQEVREKLTLEEAYRIIAEYEEKEFHIEEKKEKIEELDLSVRAYNCLKRARIDTIGELCEMTIEKMMKVKNLGKKSLKEIKNRLAEKGLSFKECEQWD